MLQATANYLKNQVSKDILQTFVWYMLKYTEAGVPEKTKKSERKNMYGGGVHI